MGKEKNGEAMNGVEEWGQKRERGSVDREGKGEIRTAGLDHTEDGYLHRK